MKQEMNNKVASISHRKETKHVELISSQKRSQVIGQFRLYRCKGMSVIAATTPGVINVSKKIGHKSNGCQFVKSHKISVLLCSLA